jgi:signal transduction histidine kinase
MAMNTKVECFNVLLVDDDAGDRQLVKLALARSSEHVKFTVAVAETLSEAVDRLSRERYDIVLLDLALPDSSGMNTVEKAREASPGISIVVLTGLADEDKALEAIKLGAEDYLVKGKPLEYALVRIIRYTIQRKRAEQNLAKLVKKLEDINRELNDFASIVSHDLKAPLRGIKTLADWIMADNGDRLTDEGKEQMGLLVNRVDRMHNLIEAVLMYSRVGREKEKKVLVNLNELVPDVRDMIAPPPHIKVTVDDQLPTLVCEHTRIMQVFQNLLSNAVKYMDKPEGDIIVGCQDDGEFWKFSVSDNGPGIEERHFDKIFQMFQTLAPRDSYESTGVGLTLVKKIVLMYGGRIWVESEVGAGSTFFFTLPRQMEAEDAKLTADIAC